MRTLQPGWLYVITDGTAYKVGRATDPESRLSSLQTGNPRQLRLVATEPHADSVGAELSAHKMLANSRIRGEWFEVDEETAVMAIRLETPQVDRSQDSRDAAHRMKHRPHISKGERKRRRKRDAERKAKRTQPPGSA